MKEERILTLEAGLAKLGKENEEAKGRCVEVERWLEEARREVKEKDRRLVEMDSALTVRESELKKVENLLALKTYKL